MLTFLLIVLLCDRFPCIADVLLIFAVWLAVTVVSGLLFLLGIILESPAFAIVALLIFLAFAAFRLARRLC